MPDWDVVVVGAGPAGATSAALLADRGYRVALIDRARFPRHKACAEYMSPGVRGVADELGIGTVIQEAGPHPVSGMEIVSPRGSRLRVRYRVDGADRDASTLQRYVLDARLVERAAASGAEIVEGVVAREPLFADGRVAGVSGTREGSPLRFSARLTVVADGTRSALARSLNLAVAPRWPIRLGLVAHFEGAGGLRDGFGEMHVGRHGYCGVAPLPGGLLNVAMVMRADVLAAERLSASAYFDRWVGTDPALRECLAGSRRISPVRGVGPIGSRTRRAWTPGAVLVGDAAGFFDPFTGEGIYRAMKSAQLAVPLIDDALQRDDVSARVLGRYDGLRRVAFRWKQAVTALVQLFVQYPALMEYALPRLAVRSAPADCLGAVLGDCQDARAFLAPPMLWSALRP